MRGRVHKKWVWGCSRAWRVGNNGFCKDLEYCVSNYGNSMLTFGPGTRLTVTPSKYFILGQEISYSLISRLPAKDSEGRTRPFRLRL